MQAKGHAKTNCLAALSLQKAAKNDLDLTAPRTAVAWPACLAIRRCCRSAGGFLLAGGRRRAVSRLGDSAQQQRRARQKQPSPPWFLVVYHG